MSRITSLTALLIAITCAFVLTNHARAEDRPAASTGSITVTVVDARGQAVEGATVRVTAPHQSATTQNAENAADTAKNQPVAESKTDKDGGAKFETIPAGDYNIAANLKGTGTARDKITVEAGRTLDVRLKLLAAGEAVQK